MTETTTTRPDTEIRRYLPHAIVATAWVLALPIVMVTMLTNTLQPPPSRLLSAFVGVMLSILATVVGTALWIRRPGSGVVSFGDLMLWGWLRRYRAERKLLEASAVLGFDRKGRPLGNVNLSVDEQLKILHELNDALETKDPYTHGHSRRVERYSFRMGMHLGLPQKQLDDLRLAAALHDVGKVAVPDEILRKPDKLDADETAVMNLHPVVGERMVSDIGNPAIVTAIRHHHEAFAGGSYPDGIAGGDIPMFSRIIAVADSYDAMTSTRPYRAGMPRKKAVSIVTEESGRQFDPKVVDAFLAQHSVPVPIPAALAQLFEVPRNLVANLAVWAKQVGASALSGAAGAAGISIVVAAGLIAPHASDLAPQNHPTEVTIAHAGDEAPHGSFGSADAGADRDRHTGRVAGDDEPLVAAAASTRRGGSGSRGPGDQVLGIIINRPTKQKPPKGNDQPPGTPPGTNNPPVDPAPPVDPPPVDPPVDPTPPVDPPGPPAPPPQRPPSTSPGGGGDDGGGGGGGGGEAPPDGGGTMPPPGPPATTPPHTPGTDPRPDRGHECSDASPGGPAAPHCP